MRLEFTPIWISMSPPRIRLNNDLGHGLTMICRSATIKSEDGMGVLEMVGRITQIRITIVYLAMACWDESH
jgi:hypothetical protein